MTPDVSPEIDPKDATSVTHFLCPEGPTKDGKPDATHHLVPRRAGTVGREPAWENCCSYCHKTEAQLRQSLPLVH